MMACFLLNSSPMTRPASIGSLRVLARCLAALMVMTISLPGCPIPVQYPITPDPENEPPVVNSEFSDPYIVMRDPVIIGGEPPTFVIVVDDPNPEDLLRVRVIKDLHETWFPTDPPQQHQLVLWDKSISPLDTLAPEDASNMGVSATTRRAEMDLLINPCAPGDIDVFLTVCVADSEYVAPDEDYPNEDPCIPRAGFVDLYPVIVLCETE